MSKVSAPVSDNDWEARSHARTLAEAERIKADPVKHGKAVIAAKKMAEESKQEAKAIQKVANRKIPTGKKGK